MARRPGGRSACRRRGAVGDPQSARRRLGDVFLGGGLGRCVDRGAVDDVPHVRRSRPAGSASSRACANGWTTRGAAPGRDWCGGRASISATGSRGTATTRGIPVRRPARTSSRRHTWRTRPTWSRAPPRCSAATTMRARTGRCSTQVREAFRKEFVSPEWARGREHADGVRAGDELRPADRRGDRRRRTAARERHPRGTTGISPPDSSARRN